MSTMAIYIHQGSQRRDQPQTIRIVLRSLMLIPDAYRRLEKEKGRSLADIGIAGVAFTRKDILEALEYLQGSQVAVLGGDVLKIVRGVQRASSFWDGKPKPTHDNWAADRRPGEDLMDYVERSIAEAERYIRSYPDPEDGTILYSPTISEFGVGSTARS